MIVRYVPEYPVTQNLPATNVTSSSAWFNGYLISTGSSPCAVCVLWGETSGGATWNWANTNWLTPPTGGWTNNSPLSINIATGIDSNKTYYYTYAGTNQTTNAVAASPQSFITGEVTVQVTDDTAQFTMPTTNTAAFTIYRPEGCTNADLTVYYTLTGTATNGVHYEGTNSTTVPLFASFGAGATSTVVTLKPRYIGVGTAILTLTSVSNYPVSAVSNTGTVTFLPFAGITWTGASSTNWNTSGNWSGGVVPTDTDEVIINTPGGAYQPTIGLSGGAVTIKSLSIGLTTNSTLTFQNGSTNRLIVTADVYIGPTGTLTHAAVTTSGASVGDEDHRLYLVVSNNLTIAQGGSVNVDNKGYAGGKGPAKGTGNDLAGGHGGAGGGQSTLGTSTYGSITNPVTAGSAGASAGTGGGVAVLRVTGSLVNNGIITANGSHAGGSVNLTAGSVSGAGTIRANGGRADTYTGGGGGGRIAVQLTASDTIPDAILTNITAYSAYGYVSYGAAGTIYLKGTNQTYGSLIVDNGNLAVSGTYDLRAVTMIGANVTDTGVGDVTIRNAARLGVGTGITVPVYGSWSNAGRAYSGTNLWGQGTVVLAGTNAATVWGSNTWYNLNITNAGKTVSFETNRLQTVSGNLTLAGASGNRLKLQSPTAGTQWKLKAAVGSTHSVNFVDVTDSDASAGNTIQAFGSIGASQNNINWSFGGATNVWTGAAGTAWNNISNWSLGRLPTYVDTVIVSNVASVCTLDSARQIGELRVLAGGVLNLNSQSLSVLGNVNNAGTIGATGTVQLAGTAAQTVTAGGNTFGTVDIANTGTVSFLDGFTAARLSCTNGGTTLNFKDGSTYTVDILYLIGSSGSTQMLRSSSSPARWKLNVTGYPVVRYVDARDSDASGGRTVYAIDSTDSTGNDINWDFGAGKFWIGGTGAWTNSANWSPAGAPAAGSYVVIEGGSVTLNVTNLLTISSLTLGPALSSTLTVSNGNVTSKGLIVTNNVIIGPYGTLTHAAETAPGTTVGDENHRLYLVVSNNMTIAQGGSINVDYQGYDHGNGPAKGTPNNIGGGHGGAGGNQINQLCDTGTNTYGSIINPVNAGSGCGTKANAGRGGGVAVLKVTGAVTLNGVISANGQYGGGNPASAGAGGSINLTAGSIAGATGAMWANGGNCADYAAAGGGRIAVQLTASDAIPNSILTNITAYGGQVPNSPAVNGCAPAGTIYLKGTNQTYGTLIVRNSHQNALRTFTTIRTNVTDAVVGDVIVGYGGMLNIDPGYSLTAYGSWSNGSGYSVNGTNLWGQGTVALAGTTAATVWGSNTWYNLSITNAGKTVSFQTNVIQYVYGKPTFDNLVTLQSTSNSVWWYLTKGTPGSTQNVGKVYVQDSNATNGMTFAAAIGSRNLGHNVNWTFPPWGSMVLVR